MNSNIDNLYNKDRKLEYISSQDFPEGTKTTILTTFRRTSFYEEESGIDLADFRSEDLIRLFEEEKWYTTNTFVAYRSIIRKYINWCILCGYCDAVDNPTKYIHMSQLSALSYQDYSIKDLNDLTTILDVCYGDSDYNPNPLYIMPRAMWYLAWFGFTKREVNMILKDDLTDDGIKTKNYEVKNIPENVMYLWRMATLVTDVEYFKNTPSGVSAMQRKFTDTPYLLRSISMGRIAQTEQLNIGTLDTWTLKAKRLQKENGLKQMLSVQKLNRFGIYSRLHDWEVENNMTATNQNRLSWGHITRKMKEGDTSCPFMASFLRAYIEWKNVFYPTSQW